MFTDEHRCGSAYFLWPVLGDEVCLTCPPAGYEGPGWTLKIK